MSSFLIKISFPIMTSFLIKISFPMMTSFLIMGGEALAFNPYCGMEKDCAMFAQDVG